jgi:hypothetical protein
MSYITKYVITCNPFDFLSKYIRKNPNRVDVHQKENRLYITIELSDTVWIKYGSSTERWPLLQEATSKCIFIHLNEE